MDDKGLDTASAQPTGQPEAIPAGLESQNDPSDHSTDFHRMIPPTLHQTKQRRWIRIQFLQGSSSFTGPPARDDYVDTPISCRFLSPVNPKTQAAKHATG
jgi:hypothetical protein